MYSPTLGLHPLGEPEDGCSMCVVSNMGDWGYKQWPGPYEVPPPNLLPVWPTETTPDKAQEYLDKLLNKPVPAYNGPTKEQFEEFLSLMRAAKKIDTLLGLKDCEMAEKLEWLRMLGKHLGVDVKDLVQ